MAVASGLMVMAQICSIVGNMSEQANELPNRMLPPRMRRLIDTIIEESGMTWRARHVQAVTNPVGSMAIRVDRRRVRGGATLFVASAFAYDSVDEGILTVHRHDVYQGVGGIQVEPFTRRYIIDPSVGSIEARRNDKAEDQVGLRDSMGVLRSINRAGRSHDPFVNDVAETNLRFVMGAVAYDGNPEAYFHHEIADAFTSWRI